MMFWNIIFVVSLAAAVGFFIGRVFALHKYAKKMLNDAYAGDLVIDMTAVDKELISIEFEKSPKDIMQYEYVMFGVKIRK